jgi:hypothetical protein
LWFLPGDNPAWDADAAAQTWLQTHAQPIGDGWVGVFRVQQYRAWEVGEAERSAIPHRVAIRLGDFGSLVGYEVFPLMTPRRAVPVRQNGSLCLVLYWAPFAAAPRDYTVFAHVESGGNPGTGITLWAQDDHPPQHGRTPTSRWDYWAAGTLLRDVYTIDLTDIPPDNYVLRVGVYDPLTGDRLHLVNSDTGQEGDAITLFEIVILPD